jgi:AcrR family transcriptional regulator
MAATGTEALPVRRQLLSREARQATILKGAAAAFARTGFAATSMEDVAAASGITKLIVYRHFASKEELYRAVLEAPGRREAVGARALLTIAREEPNGFVLLWRHAAREQAFADYAHAHRDRAVGAARRMLGDRVGDEVRTRWAAETLVDWLVEAVLGWMVVGDEARDEELSDLAARTVRAMVATWSTA